MEEGKILLEIGSNRLHHTIQIVPRFLGIGDHNGLQERSETLHRSLRREQERKEGQEGRGRTLHNLGETLFHFLWTDLGNALNEQADVMERGGTSVQNALRQCMNNR